MGRSRVESERRPPTRPSTTGALNHIEYNGGGARLMGSQSLDRSRVEQCGLFSEQQQLHSATTEA